MGDSRIQRDGSADEVAGETVLDAATLLGAANRDVRDLKYTFQFVMSAGSAVLEAAGPSGALTQHTSGLVDGDIVHTTADEMYGSYKVVWTGTGTTGVVHWWAEARR